MSWLWLPSTCSQPDIGGGARERGRGREWEGTREACGNEYLHTRSVAAVAGGSGFNAHASCIFKRPWYSCTRKLNSRASSWRCLCTRHRLFSPKHCTPYWKINFHSIKNLPRENYCLSQYSGNWRDQVYRGDSENYPRVQRNIADAITGLEKVVEASAIELRG